MFKTSFNRLLSYAGCLFKIRLITDTFYVKTIIRRYYYFYSIFRITIAKLNFGTNSIRQNTPLLFNERKCEND